MSDPCFSFIGKWFPVIALIVTAFNVVTLRNRARDRTQQDPELERGYQRLFWGYLIVTSLPWIVMAFGTIIGGVPTVWHFFYPRDGNPYVLAFHATVIVLWILGIVWIYFLGGAEFLIEYYYPLSRQVRLVRTPLGLKIAFAIGLLGGIVAMAMMWSGYFAPLPVR